MRTEDDIKATIERLRAKQAEIKQTAEDYLAWQVNPNMSDLHRPFWRVSEKLAEWSKEHANLETKIGVLEWMLDSKRAFPWW